MLGYQVNQSLWVRRLGLLWVVLFGVLGLLSACQKKPSYGYIEGQTMGTSYHIRFQQPNGVDTQAVQLAVDKRLVQINESMSTYQSDTIISRFNRLSANTPIQIDSDFIQVLTDAKKVYQASKGAFNPTVLPLVELWGFGHKMTVERLQSPPSEAEISQARQLIDFDGVVLDKDKLSKDKDGVSLDFSAIAKGYAVDVIAKVLRDDFQVENYMVEIGGEVATSGVNGQGHAWQIAIDAPILNSSVSNRSTIAVIRQPLSSKQQGSLHLATSGNYRNSMLYDGVRYSHTIDPKTGKPIVGGAPSVTVASSSVSIADAWATALTAMPYQQALDLAVKQDLAVMFVISAKHVDLNQSHQQLALEDWQVVETPKMKALRQGKGL